MTCGGASSAQVCYSTRVVKTVELEEVPMQIVGALDVHRRQITFKTLEPASGESSRGRISPAARKPLRQWLERFAGLDGEFVLEGRPAGGSWSRRSSVPAMSRVSPIRPRRRPGGAASGA